LPQIVENASENDVLVDVGKVAGVKCVLIVHISARFDMVSCPEMSRLSTFTLMQY
jgi:hypothetical protein